MFKRCPSPGLTQKVSPAPHVSDEFPRPQVVSTVTWGSEPLPPLPTLFSRMSLCRAGGRLCNRQTNRSMPTVGGHSVGSICYIYLLAGPPTVVHFPPGKVAEVPFVRILQRKTKRRPRTVTSQTMEAQRDALEDEVPLARTRFQVPCLYG